MKFGAIIAGLILIAIFVFSPVLSGKLPLPSDALIGLYHPFRDFYADVFPRGMPFKNFLITDPVRQLYPFRYLAIEEIKNFELPLWNSYNFAGTPLLANFQSAPFYFLNTLYFLLPFSLAWTLQVILQPILAGMFTYLYLRKIGTSPLAGFFGGLTFSLSGFSVVWMEWNTVVQVALWLPLVLLAIENIFDKPSYKWAVILLFALCSQLFAGHIQTSFYLLVLSSVYIIAKAFSQEHKGKLSKNLESILKTLVPFIGIFCLFVMFTFIQWFPFLQYIGYSARDIDRSFWLEPGWFIPFEHLVQFLAPDFFGNPTTLNYWGVWNYGELTGYAGLIPIVMGLFAVIAVKRKIVVFYALIILLSLVFALPNFFSALPFTFSMPFLSTAQPTRLLFLIDFSLAVLAGLGIDKFSKSREKFIYPLIIVGLILILLWVSLISNQPFALSTENLEVAKRNLILPTIIFGVVVIGFIVSKFTRDKRYAYAICFILVLVTIFDLGRFAQKFLPFTQSQYLYPQTRALKYLQERDGQFRIMSTDDRILPPNTSIMYSLQTVEGYDPLYLRRYGELIAASERGKANISPPFGFNRIITPEKYDSQIMDLIGVKYILSLNDTKSDKLKLVFEEGETKIFENTNAFPRVFSVENVAPVNSKEEAIKGMFENIDRLDEVAFVEKYNGELKFSKAELDIQSYTSNRVVLNSSSQGNSFIVLVDSFYPTWKARIKDGKDLPIYLTDYSFRGVVLPPGENVIEFYNTLF